MATVWSGASDLPEAALGHCAAKKQTFYGYRLVVMTTLDGIITDWELIPGNADEREAAWDLLYAYRNLLSLGDKGFLERLRQELLSSQAVFARRNSLVKTMNQLCAST